MSLPKTPINNPRLCTPASPINSSFETRVHSVSPLLCVGPEFFIQSSWVRPPPVRRPVPFSLLIQMNPPDPDESPSLPRGVAPPSSPSQPPLPSLLRRHLLHCQRQELEARAEVVGQPRELHARAEVACRRGSSMRGEGAGAPHGWPAKGLHARAEAACRRGSSPTTALCSGKEP